MIENGKFIPYYQSLIQLYLILENNTHNIGDKYIEAVNRVFCKSKYKNTPFKLHF